MSKKISKKALKKENQKLLDFISSELDIMKYGPCENCKETWYSSKNTKKYGAECSLCQKSLCPECVRRCGSCGSKTCDDHSSKCNQCVISCNVCKKYCIVHGYFCLCSNECSVESCISCPSCHPSKPSCGYSKDIPFEYFCNLHTPE